MKTASLIIATALLASPIAFAEDVTCQSNMQELARYSSAPLDQLTDDARTQLEDHIRLAGEAQTDGDEKGCIVHSSKALQEINSIGQEDEQGQRNSNN
ncbi:hypothetical protein SAMN05216198_2046 [Halopseudomonas litoralis]|uniref:UrcA family protein n=1 Tax=Halopseudomonas litoralis TaxID=797277 RepID=A0A1H1SJ19_9GAMM|nr:hypothetical protein [Halopseudomonas litoralis]SDS48014.1 hypothetical protein SAMN05216198_2046 [Halopseudomonas litoralis]